MAWQQMERDPGIFVAATNLMSGLDAAAPRRFDLKLHFRALNPVQRRKLFAREALGDQDATVPPEIRKQARHDRGALSLRGASRLKPLPQLGFDRL
jgi:hypothetical protein